MEGLAAHHNTPHPVTAAEEAAEPHPEAAPAVAIAVGVVGAAPAVVGAAPAVVVGAAPVAVAVAVTVTASSGGGLSHRWVPAAASQMVGLVGLGRPAVGQPISGAEPPGRSPQWRGYPSGVGHGGAAIRTPDRLRW
ncbi:MAG TPA: hypothetical protein VGP04_10420 [Pseudonocardiaceae bacterium]|nr:hypothetical protein [Pseudonocardiaceae bacterium]